MAAAHVRTATGNGSSTAPSATLAGAPTQGSLLVAAVQTKNAATFTAANGYTLVGSTGQFRMAYKFAGAGEPAAQAPCTLNSSMGWACAVTEYSGAASVAGLLVAGVTSDTSSPQDQAALDPTDNVDAILVGAAGNEAGATYSGQTIGGVAATERSDVDHASSGAHVSTFDRLNVNTGTSSFAAQATASGTPTNGAVGLVIFQAAVSVSVAPSASSSTPASVDPGVTLGSLSVAPAASSSTAATPNPTVSASGVVVVPVAASATAAGSGPNVAAGSDAVTGDRAIAVPLAVLGDVILGSLSVTPDAADTVVASVDPSVVTGELATPTAASATAASADPAVVLGALSILADFALATARTAGGTALLGAVPVTVGRAVPSEAVVGGLSVTVLAGTIALSEAARGGAAVTVAPLGG